MITPSIDRRRVMLWLAAPALPVVLSACAATGGSAQAQAAPTDEAALRARAQAYWDLVRANDRAAAWPFEELSLDPRATLQAYVRRGGIVYDKAEVRAVRSIEGDQAVLDVWAEYSVPLMRLKDQRGLLADHWRLIDGTWYHGRPRGGLVGG